MQPTLDSRLWCKENSSSGMDNRGSGEPDARRTATYILGINLYTITEANNVAPSYHRVLPNSKRMIRDDDHDDHPIRQ